MKATGIPEHEKSPAEGTPGTVVKDSPGNTGAGFLTTSRPAPTKTGPNRSTNSSGDLPATRGSSASPHFQVFIFAGQSRAGYYLLMVSSPGVTGFDGLVL